MKKVEITCVKPTLAFLKKVEKRTKLALTGTFNFQEKKKNAWYFYRVMNFVMSSLPPSLPPNIPPDQKTFPDFAETLHIIRL